MFRKLALVVVPATAFALTLLASVDSSSQAFAKGGKFAPSIKRVGFGREHWRKNFRYNRNWDRFCFGYPSFGCVEAPVCDCEVVTPVVPVVETPVVEAPVVVTPVCTTCEPVVATYNVGAEGNYRHFGKDFPRRERPLERGGRIVPGKK
jgi:hypothetical protein